MDNETEQILSEQQLLKDLVSHQGWGVARRIIADKILELQNAFELEDKTATAMLQDLRARKKAASILWAFLKEIEGGASQSTDNAQATKSHIVVVE